MKQSLVRCGLAAALLLVTASEARADPPNISGEATTQPRFIAAAGTTGFSTTFLFGRAGNDNTLLYRVGNSGMWSQIFYVDGIAPAATVDPAPGTTVQLDFAAPLASQSEVFFVLCQGNIPSGDLSQCTGQGPFYTGAGATNVLALSATAWNNVRGSAGVAATPGETVFGFEDKDLAISDQDFNDLVFSTSLQGIPTVPEPSSLALMMVGVLGMAGVAARRRQRTV